MEDFNAQWRASAHEAEPYPGRKTIKNYSVFNGFSILRLSIKVSILYYPRSRT